MLIANPEHTYLDLESGSSLDHLQAASINYRIAIGPHAGCKALTRHSVPPLDELPNNPRCWPKSSGWPSRRLGDLTGEILPYDLLRETFSSFCIGE